MLDLIPLAGTRRKMTHLQSHRQVVRQLLQGFLPQPIATAIAASAIRRYEQLAGTRKPLRTHLGPPSSNTRRRELGGVVIDTHAHPTLVAGQVVDAVGNSFAHAFVGKVVDLDFLRLALRLPLLAGVLEFSDQFLLLRVDRDHRLVLFLKRQHLLVDVLELGITVRVRRALTRFTVGLQTVSSSLQQRRTVRSVTG